jgi:hypothetical protein
LDAVLTDTGRFRLAKGDGSFKINKFAFADDEINYNLYDKQHGSGSAFYDLNVLQTPVLEAFTNNTSTMNSKLISIPRTNLLYLPIMQVNTVYSRAVLQVSGKTTHYIAVDSDTVGINSKTGGLELKDGKVNSGGILNGYIPSNLPNYIRIDQGLNTVEMPYTALLDSTLKETQYIVQLDHRLGQLASQINGAVTGYSFIDDDQIAFYYLSQGAAAGYVAPIAETGPGTTDDDNNKMTLEGPRGTYLQFKVQASNELQNSNYLFNKLGGGRTITVTASDASETSVTCLYIDTLIKVTGATTGYSIDVPVRFIKKQ